MEGLKVNENSHLTAKNREVLSFPARYLLEKGLLKGTVLDFGCGFGKDAALLREKGLDVIGYDPYYFPNFPEAKFDTILCFYVLNVLFREEQANVLMQISHLLKAGGHAYFAVRRDLKAEGFRQHAIYKKETYQCNVQLPYQSIFLNKSCEIYDYQHILEINKNLVLPFSQKGLSVELLFESALTFSIICHAARPYCIVAPKRKVIDYKQLSDKELISLQMMSEKVKTFIAQRFTMLESPSKPLFSEELGRICICFEYR